MASISNRFVFFLRILHNCFYLLTEASALDFFYSLLTENHILLKLRALI